MAGRAVHVVIVLWPHSVFVFVSYLLVAMVWRRSRQESGWPCSSCGDCLRSYFGFPRHP
mgnify:CR=1 FL=1